MTADLVIARTASYGFMVLALFLYVKTWRAIDALVNEARRIEPGRRIHRFWWTPAWRVTQKADPKGRVRKRVVLFFMATFGCMLIGMGLLAYSMLHSTHLK